MDPLSQYRLSSRRRKRISKISVSVSFWRLKEEEIERGSLFNGVADNLFRAYNANAKESELLIARLHGENTKHWSNKRLAL